MIVTKFVKAGIVERSRASKDQRTWNLSLTKAGQDLAGNVAAEQAKVVLQMVQPYTAEELALVKTRMDQSSERLKIMREDCLNTSP